MGRSDPRRRLGNISLIYGGESHLGWTGPTGVDGVDGVKYALSRDAWVVTKGAVGMRARSKSIKRGIQQAHGRIAATYGGYGTEGHLRKDGYLQGILEGILQRHGVDAKRARLLDMGCGNGAFLELYWSLGFREIAGVDFARPMLEVALGRGQKGAWDLILGDAEELPFKSTSFDLVHMYGVIQHLESPERALGEAVRVLRPRGLAIVDVPRRGSASYYSHMLMGVPPAQWGSRRRWLGWLDVRGKMRSYRFFTPQEVGGLLRGLPAGVVEVVPTLYLSLHGPLATVYEERLPHLRRRHGARLEATAKKIFKVPSGQLLVIRRR